MDSLYLWVNLGAIFFPFVLSFNKLGYFYKRWKAVFISIGVMAAFIISWDVLFTIWGVWGFNEQYLLGPTFLHLPLEEWLFFLCIPYAFMFLYIGRQEPTFEEIEKSMIRLLQKFIEKTDATITPEK